jgi:site-specific DNA-methyltransferase (adenine-specific)
VKVGKYGLNKIYNEDSYKAIKDIPDNSIDLIIIDPPYEYNSNMENVSGGVFKDRKELTAYKQINDLNINIGFNNVLLDDCLRILKAPNIYIWCNKAQIMQYMNYFVNDRNYNFDILIWYKTNAPPLFSNTYLPDKEYCLYFKKGGYCKPNNYADAKTVYIDKLNIRDKELFKHPTIKPLNIIKTLISNSSKEGDIVADFFIGSGTTAVAAKELGRNYIGFEIDKEFHKIAVDRVNGITASGQTSIFTDFEKL